MLTIEPVRTPALSLREDIVASVLTWLGHDWHLMLTELWGFELFPEDPEQPGRLGNRIKPSKTELDAALNKNYGIKIYNCDAVSKDELLENISTQLNENLPVIAHVQTMFLKYHRTYNNSSESHLHQVLVTGLDGENIYWIDAPWTSNINSAPLREFIYGVEKTENFRLSRSNVDVSSLDTIRSLVHGLRVNRHGHRSAFDAIRAFGDLLECSFDIKIEAKGKVVNMESLRFSGIFFHMELISRLRNTTAEVVRYMIDKFDLKNFNDVPEEFGLISQEWMRIRYVIMKKALNVNDVESLRKARKKLYDLAEREERLEKRILNYCSNSQKKTVLPDEALSKFDETNGCNFRSIINLDLSSYLNFRGIVCKDKPEREAQLNMSFRSYIFEDEAHFRKNWSIGSMGFIFPDIRAFDFDHVVCEGQIISVPDACYESIMLLGFSLLRAYAGTIGLYHDETFVEEINFAMTDIGSLHPRFGEEIAWSGSYFEKAEVRAASFYCKEFFLPKQIRFNRIQLPDWPMLSILAISLAKEAHP